MSPCFQELKTYLIENGGKPIFDEEYRNVLRNNDKIGNDPIEKLSGKTLNHLSQLLVCFVEYKFEKPSRNDISNVCKCALNLFTTIGGLVSIFMSTENRSFVEYS